MLADADLARVADLMTGHRASLLLALMGGQPRRASDLAAEAGTGRSLTSAHLARLLDGGLVAVEPRGRERYYRLADRRVAEAVEAMLRIAPASSATASPPARASTALRQARTCYDHLAGVLGVGLTRALRAERVLDSRDGGYTVTRKGAARLTELGVDVGGLRRSRRSFARPCLDWTERRPHLAGALGAGLADRLFELGWVSRIPGGRALRVTRLGREELAARFGVELAG